MDGESKANANALWGDPGGSHVPLNLAAQRFLYGNHLARVSLCSPLFSLIIFLRSKVNLISKLRWISVK